MTKVMVNTDIEQMWDGLQNFPLGKFFEINMATVGKNNEFVF